MLLRAINWESDGQALHKLDASFVTDRVYTVRRDGLSFSFGEEARDPAVAKHYDCTLTKERIRRSLIAIAACEEKEIRGYAVVEREDWNRRAVITDFFVDRRARRRGIGSKMMQRIVRLAKQSARILWVETQDVNFPAIAFYRRMGFEVCGFDSTLYDGKDVREVAVFLSRSLQEKESRKRS